MKKILSVIVSFSLTVLLSAALCALVYLTFSIVMLDITWALLPGLQWNIVRAGYFVLCIFCACVVVVRF